MHSLAGIARQPADVLAGWDSASSDQDDAGSCVGVQLSTMLDRSESQSQRSMPDTPLQCMTTAGTGVTDADEEMGRNCNHTYQRQQSSRSKDVLMECGADGRHYTASRDCHDATNSALQTVSTEDSIAFALEVGAVDMVM